MSGADSTALPAISVVINTLNRAASLAQTLDSLRWQTYGGRFEVIVVNGPSTDRTEQLLAEWRGLIRTGVCPAANLSMSRNIGICMAKGDIVAFIDDDGIPESEWLAQLAAAYDDPEVGAAGGRVFDHTGYEFQAEYCLVDRLGTADDWSFRRPMPQRCFPGSFQFPHLLGTNASFRRDALLAIGGFDEEFEYFLDETDLCVRLMDAGWLIRQLPDAYVHHKFAPSTVRTEKKVLKHRYPVIKNKVYFTLKHGRDYFPLERIHHEQERFIDKQRADLLWCIDNGLLGPEDRDAFERDAARALAVGRARGMEGAVALITPARRAAHDGDFLAFAPFAQDGTRTIVLVSQDYPPNHGGGIATFCHDLAKGLAALGHRVHVVSRSPDIDRVDWEQGVWVHRVLARPVEPGEAARQRRIPASIWTWSATALKEVRRIAGHRRIDVVEAPIWDCEGAAFLLEGEWPLVVSLHTTLKFFLRSHPELAADPRWQAEFGAPMLRLETELMTRADAVRANSRAIRDDIEREYGFAFAEGQVSVIPHGLEDRPPRPASGGEGCRLLFVGRLEHRKGIDLLLRALPTVLAAEPGLEARIVGDDSQPDGRLYRRDFEAGAGRSFGRRVTFTGRVADDVLRDEYAACDLLVAPSRYESFGLIFLEAMREAKPVIGVAAGGMPEIIAAEENGLLVPPDDAQALAAAILRLARDPSLRRRLGLRGRDLFERQFSAAVMARRSQDLYSLALARRQRRRHRIAYVNGVCVRHDAISAALRGEIQALLRTENAEVTLFTYRCDFPELPHRIVAGADEVAADPRFGEAELVVFHFGIYSPLFDLLSRVGPAAKKLVVFHNVTPRALLAPAQHGLHDQSMQQMRRIAEADRVICVSPTNLAVLRDHGVAVAADILPLAVRLPPAAPDAKPSATDGVVRLVFIGRFVAAKGVRDLLQAIERVAAAAPVHLDLVGNRSFSDPVLVAELDRWAPPPGVTRHVHFDADEDDKRRLLRAADILVLPSYHEGFCVPVVEALASGCRVLTYDNSNLPAIGHGLSRLVATGDVAGLGAALREMIADTASAEWHESGYALHAAAAAAYVAAFDPAVIDRAFVELVGDWLGWR